MRFGQPLLPGAAVLGPEHRDAAADILARAAAVRMGRAERFGTAAPPAERRDWHPRGMSEAWRQALHSLEDVVALGIAAATADGIDERRGWADAARDVVRDWLRRGRSASGVCASIPAQARRVPHLVQASVLLGPELRVDTATRRGLLEALYADAVALAVALPRLPADPWLVAAARALVVAGRFFDGMEARGWVELGTEALWAQLREQIHDDGGHVGRDPDWHGFVLAEYLELLAMLRAANDEVPAWSRKRVRAMADCLTRLTHPDGTLALTSGRARAGVHPPRELLAVAAVLLHEPAFASPGELPGIWPLLVLGESGQRAWAALPREPLVHTPRMLRRTGYAVLPGAPGDLLIADGAAPFAYELSIGGQRLVVGPGVGADDTDPLASYARSARARNVLVGDDAPAAVAAAEPDVRWSMRDGLVCWSASVALAPDRRHRRCIVALPGRFWIVCDELAGTGSWTGQSLVHLHPDTRILGACAGGRPALLASRDGQRLGLVFGGRSSVELSAARREPVAQGWHADAPGDFRASPTVVLDVAGSLPVVVGYALLAGGVVDAELDFERDAFQIRALLRLRGTEYEITILADEVELVVRR